MRDLRSFLQSAPATAFTGTVYRICPARFARNVVSMRGSVLHGARYNVGGYFGALYTSFSKETARREMSRYFTVPPMDGFIEASIRLRLNRVVDLTNRKLLGQLGLTVDRLIETSYSITQEIGTRAWEVGIEGLVTPSAANVADRNLAVLLDNQTPRWRVELAKVSNRAVV